MKKLVIWGAGGHALMIAQLISMIGDYELVGFIDDVNVKRKGRLLNCVPILGGKEQIDEIYAMGVQYLIIGFGDCAARLRIAEEVQNRGFLLAKAIHPKAIISTNVEIGAGTVVMGGAAISYGAILGRNVIINTCANIGHESIVEDGVHVCSGVNLAGATNIKRGAWVGIGSTVIEKITIGAGSFIGAGSVVVKDIPDGVMAYGVPCRVVRKINLNPT
jgi:UDP-N-acetylbacillosamine N-acetyltransferase